MIAIVDAAVTATGASHGWLLLQRDSELEIVAAVGEGAGDMVGRQVPATSGTAGYVATSGQPLVLSGGDDDRLSDGVASAVGRRPASVLCVPCATDDGVFGALELIDKAGGERFSFDDLELVTLLGGIAAPALASSRGGATVTGPSELAVALGHLADGDPARYAIVAMVVEALLGAH